MTMSVADARFILHLRDNPDVGKFRPGPAVDHLIRRRQVVREGGLWVASAEAVEMAERVMGAE